MQSSPTVKNQRYLIIGYAFVLIGAFGFSAKAVLIKLAYAYSSQLDAITLMMLRMVISLPFFLFMAFWSATQANTSENNYRLNKRDWLLIASLGILGYYLASWFDFRGLHYISAGLERLILFLYPTFVVLFSAILHRQLINRHQVFALLLSYAGLALVFANTLSVMPSSAQLYLGSAFVLGSAICFACFLLGSAIMIKRIGSTRFTAYSMSIACVITCLHFLIEHGIQVLQLPIHVYYLAIIMAIFATVLPSFIMNAGICRVGASSAAIISSAGPIGTIALAFFLLGEMVTPVQLIGTAFILLGVYVISQVQGRL